MHFSYNEVEVTAMPELLPAHSVNRWYRLRWPGDLQPSEVWAEKYFDAHDDALRYFERRQVELSPRQVHMPIHSHEDPGIWVVCVEPA
jgi:hypothetical protein